MLREELARATRSRIRDVEYEIKLLVEMINQEEEVELLVCKLREVLIDDLFIC